MFRRLVALGLIALTAACGSPGAARPGSGGSDTGDGAPLSSRPGRTSHGTTAPWLPPGTGRCCTPSAR